MKQHKDKSAGIVYISMEQFFAYLHMQRIGGDRIDLEYVFSEQENISDIIESYDRDGIRSTMRRFINTCGKMGINSSWFKRGKHYRITEDVANLFCYLELFFIPMHTKKIKDNKWGEIPKEHLVELRRHLVHALYDTTLSNEDIKAALENYESTTGCPITFSTIFNAVTDAAVNYWKDGNEHKLSRSQWDAIYADAALEFDSRYRIPFYEYVGDRVKEIALLNGYDSID